VPEKCNVTERRGRVDGPYGEAVFVVARASWLMTPMPNAARTTGMVRRPLCISCGVNGLSAC
jgi:hypothetical protein